MNIVEWKSRIGGAALRLDVSAEFTNEKWISFSSVCLSGSDIEEESPLHMSKIIGTLERLNEKQNSIGFTTTTTTTYLYL